MPPSGKTQWHELSGHICRCGMQGPRKLSKLPACAHCEDLPPRTLRLELQAQKNVDGSADIGGKEKPHPYCKCPPGLLPCGVVFATNQMTTAPQSRGMPKAKGPHPCPQPSWRASSPCALQSHGILGNGNSSRTVAPRALSEESAD